MHHADDCAFGVLQNASAGHGCLRDMPTGAPNRLSILCDERSYAVGSFASTKRHATGLGFTHCSASGVWHKLVSYDDARISLQRARAKSLFWTTILARGFPSTVDTKKGIFFQLSLGLSRLFVVLTHCRCCVMAVLGCDAVCASLCFSTISRRSRGIFTLAAATGQLRSGDCRFLSLATAIGHQRVLPSLGPKNSLPKSCHSAGILTFVVFWRLV